MQETTVLDHRLQRLGETTKGMESTRKEGGVGGLNWGCSYREVVKQTRRNQEMPPLG